MIDNLICASNKTLLEAMHMINESGKGACFIVDDSTLIGIATDGDIRRSILSGISLDSNISEIVSSNFTYGRESDSHEYLFSKLSEKVNIIPIVNENNKVVDYIEYTQSVHFPVATPVLSGNEFKYLTDAFCSTWISSAGSYIDKFEDEFSKYSDCAYGSAVSNGTVALHLALAALEI